MAEPGPPDRPSPSPLPRPPAPPAGVAAPHLTRGFLFADLRDYTSYVDARGDHAGADLLARYRALVRGAVAAARGAEIKTEGDSFYVVFDSASAAVRCGQEIIAAADAAAGEPIHVGVGVHAGETVETAEGFVGSAVNIAARLCAQARAGELVVSDTVRALTRTYLDVEFEPLGARRLKGVNEQIALYRVSPRGTAAARTGHARRAGRSSRWWLAGLAAVALVVVLGAAGAAVWQGTRPGPTPAPGAATSATPSAATPTSTGLPASADPRALTAPEKALLARIPEEFLPSCGRSNVEDGALGGIASLRCNLRGTSGYGADSVWYDAFDEQTAVQMAKAVNDVVDGEGLAFVDGGYDAVLGACASAAGRALGVWREGISNYGRLACYAKGGEAWLLWTYDRQGIVARAVRTDGDATTLGDWWKERAGAYLRGY